jgi:hypothetical protein
MSTNKISTTATQLSGWLFALVLVGYPLFALVGSFLDLDSSLASTPFRTVVTLLALALWVNSPSVLRWWKHYPWLLAFWLLYLMRLLWDIVVGNVPGAPQALTFFLLTSMLPGIALGLSGAALNQHHAATLILRLGGCFCLLAVLMHVLQIGQARALPGITGRLFFEALNPISIGHASTTTLVAALYLISQNQTKPRLFLIALISTMAAYTLVLSGSRGPILALAVCALLFIVQTRKWVWLVLIVMLIAPQVIGVDSELGQRFRAITEDDSSLERLSIQGNALEQFLTNPFLGSAYVELQSLEYPHNIFIEAGMAMGIIGLGALLAILWRATKKAKKHLNRGQILVPLLFTQYLVAAQFSGALWGNSALWTGVALLVGLNTRKRFSRLYTPQTSKIKMETALLVK